MSSTYQWIATLTLAASVTALGHAQAPPPAPTGKGTKSTVQGCLQAAMGMPQSSSGIASPSVAAAMAGAPTTSVRVDVKDPTVYALRAGGTVYRFMADDVTILAALVGHQVEVQGRLLPAGSVPSTNAVVDRAVAGADVLSIGKVRPMAATCQ